MISRLRKPTSKSITAVLKPLRAKPAAIAALVVGVISGGSIYPFVWNILLAARNEGYGGTPTTFIAGNETALQTLLGVPEQMAFAAMIPLGKPVKQLTRLSRKPVDEFAVLERWDGPALGSS